MKALRFHAAKDLRLETIDTPSDSLAPGQVLIKNRFVGICGTDLHEYAYGPIFIPVEPHPFTGASGPQVLGHEFGGVVEAVNQDVTINSGDVLTFGADVTRGAGGFFNPPGYHLHRAYGL